MIISTTTLKGGGGKTTIAINLAVCYAAANYSVIVIDTDANQNVMDWAELRNENRNSITTVSMQTPEVLKKNVKELAKRYDIVIIDGTPAINVIASTVMLLSDVCLFPVKASPPDLWAFNNVFLSKLDEIKEIKPDLIGKIVINEFEPHTKVSKAVMDVIGELDCEVMDTKIHDRTVYKHSKMYGLGVVEMKDKQALTEIVELVNEISKLTE